MCINIEFTYACCTLRHTATHCNTLQHIATHYNTLQHTTTHYNLYNHMHQYRIYVCVLHTNCKTLQHTATQCNTLQHTTHIIICINIESTYILLYIYIQIGKGTINILHKMLSDFLEFVCILFDFSCRLARRKNVKYCVSIGQNVRQYMIQYINTHTHIYIHRNRHDQWTSQEETMHRVLQQLHAPSLKAPPYTHSFFQEEKDLGYANMCFSMFFATFFLV